MRVLAALGLSVALLLGWPVAANADHNFTHTKCSAMVRELNARRSPNVEILYALCIIGRERAQTMVANDEAFHDLDYAIARLEGLGWSWGYDVCGIGEVIGWTTATEDRAERFVNLWLASDRHDFIASSFYHRAGGSYELDDAGRAYVAFYVVRVC